MSFPLPRTSAIIGYRDIFEQEPPEDRLSLIKHLSKDIIILELAGLNYRLAGGIKKAIDTEFDTQKNELFYFCGEIPALNDKYASKLNSISKGQKSYVFTRQACLFGMEEVIQSNISIIEDFKMGPVDTWESLLQYILCVNNEITKVQPTMADEPINFETLSPKLLPLSELLLIHDPFYVLHRGLLLMEYLSNNNDTRELINEYFQEKYNITYDHFVFELHRMWMANKIERKDLRFYYIVPEDDKYKSLFDVLSDKYSNDQYIKLLNIRKNPFLKREKNHYILTDQSILLDKSYYQFINDFWFDKVNTAKKTNGKPFKMQDYKSIIGYFFESYVNSKVRFSFAHAKDFIIKTFEELKVKGKLESEIGDIYIRHEAKIILGEVKSTSIYDNEKYGGNVDALYKNDREAFFKVFGIDQLVNNLLNLEENIKSIDPNLKHIKKIRIWPVIVFNERVFQTPMMAQIFNKRFKEVLIQHPNKNIYIYPLTLIHISDLETMESVLNKNPNKIWDLLSSNFKQKINFIPPFYITLNRQNVKANYQRIKEKLMPLFNTYGTKDVIE